MIEFIITWIFSYVLIMLSMVNDNITWIKSSPEYSEVILYRWKNYLKYVLNNRILAVLRDKRDVVPAVFSSLALALAIRLNYFIGFLALIFFVVFNIWRIKR
jgi:hypothetical protein